jgi:hypothetical protein
MGQLLEVGRQLARLEMQGLLPGTREDQVNLGFRPLPQPF